MHLGEKNKPVMYTTALSLIQHDKFHMVTEPNLYKTASSNTIKGCYLFTSRDLCSYYFF